MGESWATRRARWAFNWFPAYRGTGARIEYIAADWLEVRVRLPLSWRTRNYVGSIFGGSLYGAVDPVYMLMLIHALGPEYIVWDKAAVIRFSRPGRTHPAGDFSRHTRRYSRRSARRPGCGASSIGTSRSP